MPYIFFTLFVCPERQVLKISKKEKSFHKFSDKEAKFCNLKYFLIIKHFFSFYYIFFYTEQAFVLHFLRPYCS